LTPTPRAIVIEDEPQIRRFVLTQRQLLREVWRPPHGEQSHYLRIYMGHLRQKLEADSAQPRHLLTETAVGYRLVT
jgi:two-component system KDP operon response regulator KdpE